MGFYRGPSIVTDGLVFAVDAGSERSYSGSGTTVNNLISSTTATLTNGTGFSTSNGGLWTFDGTDDYIQVNTTTTPATGAFTIEFIYQISNTGGRGGMFERNPSAPYNGVTLGQGGPGDWSFAVNNGSQSVQYSATYPTTNTWYHDVGVYNGVNTVTFYRNGVLLGTTTGSTLGNLDTGGTRDDLRIFRRDSNSGVIGGKVANFRTYNVALTAAQVLQNYNAQKSRFGL
jgi:hypothetical protein